MSKAETVLIVNEMSKKFCRDLKRSLLYGMRDLASEMLLMRARNSNLRQDEFWALQDISFELKRGETLGLIGHNGAGKSTLLKLLNGLIKPDKGYIEVHGRVGALIELGAGFNPILTGRENIYVNGAILGLTKKEVERRLEEIIDFAEIGEFIDAPVQSYSSGMKVRLGFSIASNLNPDILLVDEVLSVGDSSFRERCVKRLEEYRKNGGTIIFVSHNSTVVESLCDRVLWLERGQVKHEGSPSELIQKYEMWALEVSRQAETRLLGTGDEAGKPITLSVDMFDITGEIKTTFDFMENMVVRVHYEVSADISKTQVVIGIQKSTHRGTYVAMVCTGWDGVSMQGATDKGIVKCTLENPPLSPGNYCVFVGMLSNTSGQLGEKWLIPMTELTAFSVAPGLLTEKLPGVPAAHIVGMMPPLVLEHSWVVHENENIEMDTV